jgi:riboflavin synthase
MFTGIIETMANVTHLQREGTNLHITLNCSIAKEFKVDQSVSHNGVCLTVVKIDGDDYTVTAIDETLRKTNLGSLKVGDMVNIERCMQANGRFDGHIVQGHADTTAVCRSIKDLNGSYVFNFEYEPQPGLLTVEKGSITVNGVSLTVVDSDKGKFSVHIIPYTYAHTNFGKMCASSVVNLEFDIIGKYVSKILAG